MIKKKDIILIVVILGIALIGLVVVHFMQAETGGGVTITVDGQVYGTYDIDQDQEIEINELGYNKVVIEDGYVYMESADCPDKYCVQHAKINKEKETIICLPHKLVVEITEGDATDVDVVTN